MQDEGPQGVGFMRRVFKTVIAALALVMSAAVPSWAASIQIGDPITIELLDNGVLPNPAAFGVAVVAGPELAVGDGTEIGNDFMLPGEFIDVGAASIQFGIRGGGAPTDTGYGPNARYVISGLIRRRPDSAPCVTLRRVPL